MALRARMYQALIHYYMALKLSAGAVTPMFGSEFEHQPAPIVRRSFTVGETQWNPLEVVSVGVETGIVTLPHGGHRLPPPSFISSN